MSQTIGKKRFVIAIPRTEDSQSHFYESVTCDGFYREEVFLVFYNNIGNAEQEISTIALFKKWDYIYEEGTCE